MPGFRADFVRDWNDKPDKKGNAYCNGGWNGFGKGYLAHRVFNQKPGCGAAVDQKNDSRESMLGETRTVAFLMRRREPSTDDGALRFFRTRCVPWPLSIQPSRAGRCWQEPTDARQPWLWR